MAVSSRFILSQGAALKGMGGAAVGAVRESLGLAAPPAVAASVPGPVYNASFAPRSPELVKAYVRNVGGSPSNYKRRLPPHLFPQWAFALAGKTLNGQPYPLLSAMNGGCKLIQNHPLPSNEPLRVQAQLVSVDDNGQRAILEQRVVTSTDSVPEALVAHMYVFVPLTKKGGAKKGKARKAKERVPEDVRELDYWKLRTDAGLDFAKLTGDFNPIHWIPAYARAFGFRNTILHGFGTMARAMEGLNRNLFAGDVDALRELHVRFTRPLVLPAKVGLYVRGDELWVGTAPGGPAFLKGTMTLR